MRALRRSSGSDPITGILPILAAALLWSTLGLFYRVLIASGMQPVAIAFARAAGGGIAFFGWLALRRPRSLWISLTDLPAFAMGGLASVTLFYLFFIEAVSRTTIATAVVLLYTAPAWVALISRFVWGERLTARRLAALALAIAGTALVAGGAGAANAAEAGGMALDRTGILYGLAAGLTYAIYSIYGSWAVERYESATVVTWALLFGALFLMPLLGAGALAPAFDSPRALASLLAVILGPTVGAYALYTYGLRHVRASTASLVATVEPVGATLLAWAFLSEAPTGAQIAGGLLVLGGLYLLYAPGGRRLPALREPRTPASFQ